MIKNWTRRKSMYLKLFYGIQVTDGSVNAGKLAQKIGHSRTTAHSFLNYMIDNGLITLAVSGLYKLTDTGKQLYDQEWGV